MNTLPSGGSARPAALTVDQAHDEARAEWFIHRKHPCRVCATGEVVRLTSLAAGGSLQGCPICGWPLNPLVYMWGAKFEKVPAAWQAVTKARDRLAMVIHRPGDYGDVLKALADYEGNLLGVVWNWTSVRP